MDQEPEADAALFLAAKEAARFPVLKETASSVYPSQIQAEWWVWRRDSPHQLSGEKLVIEKLIHDVPAEHISRCIQAIVSRHSVLRSSLAMGKKGLRLALNKPEDMLVEIERLSSFPDQTSAEAEARRRAALFAAIDLRVSDSWVIRAKVIVLSPSDALLVMVLHHLVVDGPSIALIQKDLEKLLSEKSAPDVSSAPTGFQLVDYAEAERLWFRGEAGKCLLRYWRTWLGRQHRLHTPAGKPLTWQPGVNVASSFAIPTGIMDMVQALSFKIQTIPFLFYLTVYAIALSRWSKQESFAIRCVGSLRGSHAPVSMVGNLVTADPIEVYVAPEDDFLATLQRVTTEYINATQLRIPSLLHFPAHPDYPGIERELFTGDIAATMNFLSTGYRRGAKDPVPAKDVFTGPAWPPVIARGNAEEWPALLWPIILRLYDMGSEGRGMFEFNESLISPQEQTALISMFFKVLEEFVAALRAGAN